MVAQLTIPGIDVANLTPAQLSGLACLICDGFDGPMIPVGTVDGCQLFAHKYCAAQPVDEPAPANAIIVIGPVGTDAERDCLTASAFDVCDQLGRPTVVATSDDIDVRDFAAVVICGPALSDPLSVVGTAMVLEAEAALYDMPVIVAQPFSRAALCEACGQLQTIATVRNAHGEVFCADCRGEALGCSQCFADESTEPVYVDGGWVPMCKGCAGIAKALKPSVWNPVNEAEEPLMLLGVAV